jgi:hypothetical protein
MMQLARRDIMVFDVEIFEFTKKKISFKETKGGVLIKNKKFNLDGSVETVTYDDDIPPPEYLQPTQFQPMQAQQQPVVVDSKQNNQAIRWEVFDPDPALIGMLTRKYRLSPKRKYPIFEEKTVIQNVRDNVYGGMTQIPGYEYVIIDDAGQRIRVPSMHFMPESKGLIGMENARMTEQDYKTAPRLMHMDQYSDPGMPVIRR